MSNANELKRLENIVKLKNGDVYVYRDDERRAARSMIKRMRGKQNAPGNK